LKTGFLTALLVFVCLLGNTGAHAGGTLYIDDNEGYYQLANLFDYFVDDEGSLTIGDVTTQGHLFKTSKTNVPNPGFIDGAAWAKINIQNKTGTPQNLLLVLSVATLQTIDFFSIMQNGTIEKSTKLGLVNANSENHFENRFPNFQVSLQPDEIKTVYVRVTAPNVVIPLEVWKADAFIKTDHFNQYLQGCFYGMLSLIGLYNFLLFFVTREKTQLYYIGYIFSLITAMSLVDGSAVETFGLLASNHSLLFTFTFSFLGLIFLGSFTANFLPINEKYPEVAKVIRWFRHLILLSLPAVMLYSDRPLMSIYFALVCATGGLIYLAAGIYCFRKNEYLARFYLVAWSVLLLGISVLALKLFNIVPHNTFTQYSVQIGSLFEATLQSIGLAAKINLLQKERNQAQQQVITAQQEANQQLEIKVNERTHQLEQLASKLAKYLSPQIYTSVFSGENEVCIATRRKRLTIFFSDIKGFTEITDSLEAEVMSDILNTYLDEMSQIAIRHGGTIDKFIGDAVMVFFGDPETRGPAEDALACAKMAIDMRDRMIVLREKWHDEGMSRPLRIRCGINTGFCTVGNFGSEHRMDYTIVGGQVNLASRLESNAETDQILISHETWALIKDQIECEKKEEIFVKGINRPIQTYQIVGAKA
jgi:class 3 adenylate cyclase